MATKLGSPVVGRCECFFPPEIRVKNSMVFLFKDTNVVNVTLIILDGSIGWGGGYSTLNNDEFDIFQIVEVLIAMSRTAYVK